MSSIYKLNVASLTPEQVKVLAARLVEEEGKRKEYSRKYWERKKEFNRQLNARVAAAKK